MDQMVEDQQTIVDAISKILTNFNKDAEDRKTLPYLEERIKKLNKLWDNVSDNHTKILARFAASHPDHLYFEDKQFDQITTLYQNVLQTLTQKADAIKTKGTRPKRMDTPHRTPRRSESDRQEDIVFKPEQKARYQRQEAKATMLSRNIHQINQELQDESRSTAHFSKKLELLQDYWHSFSAIHDDIVANAELHEFETEYFKDSLYETQEENYIATTIKLQEKIDSLSSIYKQVGERQTQPHLELKLPTIQIPNFYGDYTKWRCFHDIFTNMIHENSTLSDIHKMNYLKTNIGGAALKLISHLSITEDNYATAWNILKQRFDNKRIIASNHINSILTLPSYNTESINGIRSLHDTTKEHLHALCNLGIDTSTWGPLIIQVLLQKLDKETHRIYETTLNNPKEIQTIEHFLEFLENRFQSLEALSNGNKKLFTQNYRNQENHNHPRTSSIKSFHSQAEAYQYNCCKCNQNHKMIYCKSFQQLAPKEKLALITNKKHCINCLGPHDTSDCRSSGRCRECNNQHHTLLHPAYRSTTNFNKQNTQSPKTNALTSIQKTNTDTTIKEIVQLQAHFSKNTHQRNILLGTALVRATTGTGQTEFLRILIDPGSQATFITEEAVQRLNLPKTHLYAEIAGIGGKDAGTVKSKVICTITPRFPSDFIMEVEALVFKKLTKLLPNQEINAHKWQHIQNLRWADPNYNTPGPIDMILGADHYGEILLSEVIKTNKNEPVAQKTELGWTIFGNTHNNTSTRNTIQAMTSFVEIEQQLKAFWELEELHPTRELTPKETQCEQLFEKTHSRDKHGRYTVEIPFDEEQKLPLGKSKKTAVARLLQVEKRLYKDANLKQHYQTFMKEYLELKHMMPVQRTDEQDTDTATYYYLPHHPVIKDSSTTTKVRVVFDASAKTTTGTSLNDTMLTGPTLQQDILSIIMRWRKHKYVYTADIEKMFRQIKIVQKHQPYQKILWRDSAEEPLQEFNLTTVTYGTASATYLAVRTLRQLATDDKKLFPIGAEIVLTDFYVDDLMSGNDTIELALEAQKQLIQLLKGGGFNLRKWTTNDPTLLKNLPEEARAFSSIKIDTDDTIKALGITWNPSTDEFEFKVNFTNENNMPTKRKILADASRLFDPLGWLAPSIVVAKILLQDLWIAGLEWDQPVPEEIKQKWLNFRNSLIEIEKIKIPRWTQNTNNQQTCEIHGFCDASEKAYAAVVYSRTMDKKGKISITLLAAKTKVAPIKTKVSIPRLELCGAVLLNKLIKKSTEAMNYTKLKTVAWTDSTIVLGWIRGKPNNFKTFVANRISEIQSSTHPTQWKHVKTEDNPADCASRGINPDELKNHNLWWNGPKWLQETEDKWPENPTKILESDLEKKQKTITSAAALITSDLTSELLKRCSSKEQTIRILCYCKRFIHNCRNKKHIHGSLTTQERHKTLLFVIKTVQQQEFSEDIRHFEKHQQFHRNSKLLPLNPFFDNNGILRVGGRLQHANLSFAKTHPIIMPHNNTLSTLLVNEAHNKTLHGGTSLTLAYLRQKYWIINARTLTRRLIHQCIRCHRYNSKNLKQLMGTLPQPRVTISRPFTHTGVDYAGPIQIRVSKGRGNKAYKGWIAVFICLATKAIHIELVSELTSEAFIAAFRRFTARRGICTNIYSDNGTNFTGANKQLEKDFKRAIEDTQKEASTTLAKDGTQWHFIPPAAPHFGGLWEAGVKSIKYHLRRVIGDSTLTFEEMTTLLAQIEACLNSRPLCPITSDPTDLDVLTPGHFLIGGPIVAPPEPCLLLTKANRLNRWKLIQKMRQDFWKSWSTEYLSRLQQRPKWLNKEEDIEIGKLVLIKDDQSPPSKWPLGRITTKHPGEDGITRVVSIKTADKVIKRCISKISPLPSGQEKEEVLHLTQSTSPESTKYVTQTALVQTFLFLLTLLSLNVRGATALPFEINTFKTSPGLFFERAGTVNWITNNWNLIVYYNMEPYHMELGGFERCISSMTKVCDEAHRKGIEKNTCDIIVSQLQNKLDELKHADEILQELNHIKRRKRALFNGVGYAMNSLFGVLDQHTAAHFEEQIQFSKDNDDHLLALIKNQTSIIEATNNVLKRKHQLIQQQFKTIDKTMTTLLALQNITSMQESMTSLLSTSIQSILIFMTYQRTQDMLLDVVTSTRHGKISPFILTPDQLRQQITMIRGNLPYGVAIPVSDKDEIAKLYELMHIRTRVTRKNIILNIKIPLIKAEDFEVYRLLPLPTIYKAKHVFIVPASEYLIINLHRDQYYPMGKEELNNCKTDNAEKFWCDVKKPIYSTGSNISKCEVEMLKLNNKISSNCVIRSTETSNVWIQLLHSNSWLFTLQNEHTFNILCEGILHSVNLKESGIVKLGSGCEIRDGTSTINSRHTFNTTMNTAFVPSTNLSTVIYNKTTKNAIRPILSYNTDSDLAELSQIIQEQKAREIQFKPTNHDIHQYTVTYIILAGLVITAVLYAMKKIQRQKKTRNSTPKPTPRQALNIPPIEDLQ